MATLPSGAGMKVVLSIGAVIAGVTFINDGLHHDIPAPIMPSASQPTTETEHFDLPPVDPDPIATAQHVADEQRQAAAIWAGQKVMLTKQPKQSQPKQSQPKQSSPKQSQPKQSQPKQQAQPKQSQPKQSSPKQSQPKQSQPKQQAQPKQSQPKQQAQPKQSQPKQPKQSSSSAKTPPQPTATTPTIQLPSPIQSLTGQ